MNEPISHTRCFDSKFRISLYLACLSIIVLSGLNIFGQQPDRGFRTANSYATSGLDAVNMANGNLILNIPVATLPVGRGGSPGYGISLQYNSKLWESKESIHDNGYPDENGSTKYSATRLHLSDSGGWRLATSYNLKIRDRLSFEMPDPCWRGDPVEHMKFRWKVEMEMPDGGIRTFYPTISYGVNTINAEDGWSAVDTNGTYYQVQRVSHPSTGACHIIDSYPQLTTTGMTYITMDGSQLRLFIPYQSGNWKLFFPDGRLVENAPPDDPAVFQRLTDRNGNGVEHRADGICDDVGRCITFSGAANGGTDITVKGVGGETLTTRIEWADHWVQRKYRVTTALNAPEFLRFETARASVWSVKKIVFPEQLGTQEMLLEYYGQATPPGDGIETDEWGELATVILPTSAKSSFHYMQEGDTAQDVLARWSSKKKLEYTEHYSGEAPVNRTVTWLYHVSKWGGDVTAPDGSFSAESKHYSLNLAWWTNGLTYLNSNPDTLVERIWAHNIPYTVPPTGPYPPGIFSGTGSANAYVKTELTTLRHKNGSISASSPTAIKDYKYDKNGNVTEMLEYEFVPYGSITRSGGVVTALPALTQKRRTIKSYYNQAAPAESPTANQYSYSDPSSPKLKQLLQSTEIRDPAGTPVSRTEFIYDDPDNRGNLIETRVWDSSKGPYTAPLSVSNSISTFSEYDQYGNVVATTDARGARTTTTFGAIPGPAGDVTGLYPTRTTVASNYPSIARTSAAMYDFYTGVPTMSADLDNDISNFTEYDALGRPTKVRSAANTPLESWTRTEYDDEARKVVVRSDVDAKGDGRKVATQFYDQLGRVRLTKTLEDASTQSAINETDGIKIETRYAYDDPTPLDPDDPGSTLGMYTLISNPYRSANAAAATNEQTMGWTLNYVRIGGRHSAVTSFSGAALPSVFGGNNSNSTGVVLTEIDANATTVTDQAGKKRRSIADSLGQLVRVDEPDGTGDLGSVSMPTLPTHYSFNPLGKMVRVQQGVQDRFFMYDSLARLVRARQAEQEINPALNTSNDPQNNNWTAGFIYDVNGNLRTSIDARNIEMTTSYDALNRPIERTYSDSTPPVIFTYDDPAIPNSKGKLTKIASDVSETRYLAYDKAGRLIASEQYTDEMSYPTNHKYNLAGFLVEQIYPSGRVVRNFRDGDGSLAGIASRSTNSQFRSYGANIEYSASGVVKQLQLGNGLWESTELNGRNQVIEQRLGTTAVDGNRWKLNYHYGELDPNGYVDSTKNTGDLAMQTITVTGMPHPFVQRFKYDSLHRITEGRETSNGAQTWMQSFGYDRYGNRTGLSQNVGGQQLQISSLTLPQVDPNTNRFLPGQGYEYDAAGNMTGDPDGRDFIFTADNKQSVVTDRDGSPIGEYLYDGNGKRIKKITQTETVVFVYDGLGNLIAELSTAPPVTSPTVNYTTADTLGSPRVVTNSRAEIVSRRDFMPFGEELASDPAYRTANFKYGSVDGVRQKFTGYERDDETDLDFAQNRMYANKLGRFTAIDPVGPDHGNPQTLNRFQYCVNNPLRYVDKNGKYEEDVHRDLTRMLAYAAGFSEKQSNQIAESNQRVDDDLHTSPYFNHKAREDFHFTTEERRNELWEGFKTEVKNGAGQAEAALGRYFHALQDSFSHKKYGPGIGHLLAGHDPDKTDLRQDVAESMAKETFKKMIDARTLMAKYDKSGQLYKPISYGAIAGLVSRYLGEADPEKKKGIGAEIMRRIRNGRAIQRDSSTPIKTIKVKPIKVRND